LTGRVDSSTTTTDNGVVIKCDQPTSIEAFQAYNAKLTLEQAGDEGRYVVDASAMYMTALQGFNVTQIQFVHDEANPLTFYQLDVLNEAGQVLVTVTIETVP